MSKPILESPRPNPSMKRLDHQQQAFEYASLEKNELLEAEAPNTNDPPSLPSE